MSYIEAAAIIILSLSNAAGSPDVTVVTSAKGDDIVKEIKFDKNASVQEMVKVIKDVSYILASVAHFNSFHIYRQV